TSPTELLTRAPEALCAGSEFDRALLSRIVDGSLVAEAIHAGGDASGEGELLDRLRRAAPRLEHPLIEAEVMRRGRATIVLDAQLHPRVHRATAEAMGWESYAAAPLLIQGAVIAMLHADRRPPGRGVDALDRDVLWTFALGFAQIFETASLRRTLR